jgi:SMC interacting uncharacterized protein involved in chromosome segregation
MLVVKDAETAGLRHKVGTMSDDLKHMTQLLLEKEDEAARLRITVDGLRGVLREKDSLFSQLQAHAEELELLRVSEAERAGALEKALHTQQQQQQDSSAAECGTQTHWCASLS